jgi:hypothetical protein
MVRRRCHRTALHLVAVAGVVTRLLDHGGTDLLQAIADAAREPDEEGSTGTRPPSPPALRAACPPEAVIDAAISEFATRTRRGPRVSNAVGLIAGEAAGERASLATQSRLDGAAGYSAPDLHEFTAAVRPANDNRVTEVRFGSTNLARAKLPVCSLQLVSR